MSVLGFLGALAGPVISGVSNAISGNQNLKAVRETNAANFKLAQWQNEQNINMWNMNNAYNAPSAQMQRLKDAGLNPNLVYGNGSVGNSSSAPTAATAPTMQAYQMPQNMFGDLSSAMDSVLKAAQIKKTEQETENLNQTQRVTRLTADKINLEIIGQNFANAKTELEQKYWAKQFDAQLRIMEQSGDKLESEVNLNFAKENDLWSQRYFRDQVQTPNVQAQTKKSLADTASTIAEMGLIGYRKQLIQSQIQSNLSSAAATLEGINLTEKQQSKISAEIALLAAQHNGVLLENEVKQILSRNGINLKSSSITGLIDKLAWGLHSLFGKW